MVAAAPPVQPGMVATGVSISITYELVNEEGPRPPGEAPIHTLFNAGQLGNGGHDAASPFSPCSHARRAGVGWPTRRPGSGARTRQRNDQGRGAARSSRPVPSFRCAR